MGPQTWARPLKVMPESTEVLQLILLVYLFYLFPPAMSSTPTYSFLLTSFKSGHVFANTTWARKTGISNKASVGVDLCALFPGPGPNVATRNPAVIPRVDTINLATHFGHARGQTGCGRSTDAEKRLQSVDFYLCPGDHPDTSCQQVYEFFCPYWTCVTLATYSGGPTQSSTLSIARNSLPKTCTIGACNPLTITIHNPNSAHWYFGMTWGLRLYVTGFDYGTLFTIQKRVLVPRSPPKPIGPLTDLGVPMFHQHLDKVSSTVPLPIPAPPSWPQHQYLQSSLMSILNGMHQLLNVTQPKLAQDCWLCIKTKPPYYIGLGVEATLNISPLSCQALPHSLMLGDVSGNASCLISTGYNLSASPFQATCNQSLLISLNASVSYQAPTNTWLACTSGLTRCINGTEPEPVLCVLVHVLPQVYMYSGPEGQHLITSPGLHSRFCQAAPLFVPVLVGLSVAGSAAISTAALVKGETGLMSLSQQVDADLGNLQSAVNMLHTQVDSLAEVALQKRRGLDLLFLSQEGLCATLGENCCFYANRSGVVKDTLQRVQENLHKRQQERENSTSWYQNMFNWSPWLTTFLTLLAGPFLLLLLGLIFGPYILNWLLNVIRQHTALVKFIYLRTRYNP
uniref:Envelope polyprotein n=1 Tax=Callithrix jacchus TaxID=9483 RepID=A0A8I4A0P9_CALJA|nr:endogenous retrovirus group FC1 Env polyprotein isoform X1 [Callithrix jacchus]XP_054106948.1 endogenous retrovirus group FC1 Env polyprotein isoform X1 [Callithrix jacchus]XP_054106949.1 endogenous retrovirus group FC1 Env polyprotein isoform X1 [Callithrix jacchus]XP_054106950.1 endogenous retrovirus group FC1 Env polyprotein isoform X1 [Callithrix jacchus]XP_054106951.1 endogenous retrovirus group FC1 Env polyprotein isoform X1 [Callithrix jacchus]XP_054106952.1 endogenous retrovirus gro